jgi:hypothetical protein
MYGACSSFSTVCAEPLEQTLARQIFKNPFWAFQNTQKIGHYSTKGMLRGEKIAVLKKIFVLNFI